MHLSGAPNPSRLPVSSPPDNEPREQTESWSPAGGRDGHDVVHGRSPGLGGGPGGAWLQCHAMAESRGIVLYWPWLFYLGRHAGVQ